MKILINASNLHVGGGIQVAASFINELIDIDVQLDLTIVVSSEVDVNILSTVKNKYIDKYFIIDVHGISKYTGVKKQIFRNLYDVCFTIFGPIYHKTNAKVHVTGFAQPWIAYPNNLVYKKINIIQHVKNKFLFAIKEYFFKRDEHLIVEAEHVKLALINIGYDKDNISVVSNTVSSIFDSNCYWRGIDFKKSHKFTLGFIGRNYKHKNLSILNNVNKILVEKFDLKCDFLFTLNENEMLENGFEKLENFYTVGSISVEQCPSFYQQIDALIFPSLLECFSATPIEAMKMEKLVIASDLPFVTDICKSSARYFDPLSAESIAFAIYTAVNEDEKNNEMIIDAKKIVNNLPTAKDRAEAYLNILLNIK